MSKTQKISDYIYKNYDTEFVKVKFNPIIEKQLLAYQYLHIMTFIKIFKNNEACAIDFSSTGTGKTYTTIALCSQQNYEPIIICPKSVIGYWTDVCNIFNVKAKTIINYESIKKGNELNEDMVKKKSDIIELNDNGFKWKNLNKHKNIIIFDEAHRCKNHKSLNGKLLLSCKNQCRVLLLSATIAQKYDDFKIFGYMLGFYKNINNGKKWIQGLIREEMFKFKKESESQLTKLLYPKKGSRMSYSDLKKSVFLNRITTHCYTLDDADNQIMKEQYNVLKDKKAIHLTEQLKARQKIEELKIPIFIELTEKYLDEDKSVIIFVNFLNSLNTLTKYFKNIPFSYICGDQTIIEKTNNVNLFQNNTNKLIICMIQAGGESISLHDLDGEHPRVTLISPSFSGHELIQALGRAYRNGCQSMVEQKIIFCDEQTEKRISQKINDKIKFLNNFADFDKINTDDFTIKIE